MKAIVLAGVLNTPLSEDMLSFIADTIEGFLGITFD